MLVSPAAGECVCTSRDTAFIGAGADRPRRAHGSEAGAVTFGMDDRDTDRTSMLEEDVIVDAIPKNQRRTLAQTPSAIDLAARECAYAALARGIPTSGLVSAESADVAPAAASESGWLDSIHDGGFPVKKLDGEDSGERRSRFALAVDAIAFRVDPRSAGGGPAVTSSSRRARRTSESIRRSRGT